VKGLEPLKMRLRDKTGDKLSTILHNEKILKDYNLFDKKTFVIE
jgi:hypothetical protein